LGETFNPHLSKGMTMTQYAALIYTADNDPTQPSQAEVGKAYAEFGENNGAALRGGAGLHHTSTATTVRVKGGRGGDVVTTDGPFAEAREVLAGFYLLEAADLDEAVNIAAQIPGAWEGAVELRPVLEM
jgi:hypothetical protein